ncbi:MAG TPA: flagellar hook capping FlgD N-terminal domain-containing protein [Symbiobacteriaceae bacterium]|nr:flagellar hook capping FlgD N-terminal domain-containing protein [Symbiobacteriaceae bacterium]
MAGALPDVSSWYKVGQTSTTGTQSQTREHKTTLGKDDFLKLLITQMRYQDPLKPMEDKEYIAQLAQFSSLEQMMNVGKATSMNYGMLTLGRKVTGTTEDGAAVTGVATSARIVDGTPMIKVKKADGSTVDIELAKITQVDLQ